MTFLELVNKLGIKVVAKRLGITESTLRKWLRNGPSKKGTEKLEIVIKRHLRSIKSAETKKRKQTILEYEQVLNIPPESELPAEEVLPDHTLESDPDVRLITPGEYEIKSEKNIGSTTWVTIGKPAEEVKVEELYEIAVDIWKNSKRDYCVLKFLLFRYIPKTSTHAVVDRRGRWVDHWWTSDALSTQSAIHRRIEYYLNEFAYKWTETRIIWFESMGVSTFDRISEMPTREEVIGRKLR